MSIDILALIQADGFVYKKVASTHGGEYAGPCPFCGGNDRFLIWPESKGGRFWCRGCDKSGDSIQYIRETRDLTFFEALEYLGIEKPQFKKQQKKKTGPPIFKPKIEALPPAIWMEKAAKILTWSQTELWNTGGQAALDILTGKGLSETTIRAAGIGWNPGERGKDIYRERHGWGLAPEVHRDGKQKHIWIPAGIIIPLQDKESGLLRLRVRRNDPGNGPRYVIVAGSSMAPLVLESGKDVFVIVESELDAWLIWQEAGTLARIVALGSANMKPDKATHEILKSAGKILNALDYDPAGARYAWKFWPETYGEKVIRWPVPVGKDPSEAWQQGLNIRAWIEAGIE
jgi:DNA primase